MVYFTETFQKRMPSLLGNSEFIEKLLAFGKELKLLSVELKQEYGTSASNKRAIEVIKMEVQPSQGNIFDH